MTEAEIHAEFYNVVVKNSKSGIWLAELREPLLTSAPEERQVEHLFNSAAIVDCNESFARMYGFSSPHELLGSLILRFLVREDKRNLEVVRQFIRSGYRIEKAVTHETDRNGDPRCFVNDAFGNVEDQRLIRMCGVQEEITDQKKIELDREALLLAISPRQRLVMQLRADGYSLKQAAYIMNISYDSARTHQTRLKKHLNITTEEALVQFAIRLGLTVRGGWSTDKQIQLPQMGKVSRRKR